MATFTYRLDKKLIVVPALFHGKSGDYDAELIFDTGASLTILDPIAVYGLGYSQTDQSGISTVHSPLGKETGFRLRLPALECLGKKIENIEVACHSLGLSHIDGLLGMNFLELFPFYVDPAKRIIEI